MLADVFMASSNAFILTRLGFSDVAVYTASTGRRSG